MEDQEIKTRADIQLLPNKHFVRVDHPYLYQKRMILLMLKRPRMINGDDVGLGKTIESIIHFSYLKAANPKTKAVVFTEKITLKQWEDHFANLTTGISTRIVTAETHPDPKLRISALRQFSRDVIITTYSLMYDYDKYLYEGMGERFVLYMDEPSYFKSTDSILHKKMEALSIKAARAYGLTATIIENRLEEAFGQFKIIYPGLISSKVYFEDNFCIRKLFRKPRYHYRTIGYKNLKVFRDQIQPGFYGRVKSDPEVLQDLPDVIETDLKIILGKAQSEKLIEAMDKIIQMPAGQVEQLTILTALIRAQQIADDPALLGFDLPSAKTEALIEALSGSLSGQKVLVHSKLRTAIDKLEEALEKAKIPTVRITGAESTEQRTENAAKFMDPQGVNVLLMTRAGLKGIDLQAGAHFVWYDLPWSWGHYRQGIGRIERTGSLHAKVGSHRMLATLHPEVAKKIGTDQTIDNYNLMVIQRKAKLVAAITDETDTLEATDSDIQMVYKEIRDSYRKKVA